MRAPAAGILVLAAAALHAQYADPKLADYAAWQTGSKSFETGNTEQALVALRKVWEHQPVSPVLPNAVLLAVTRMEARDATQLLRRFYDFLPEPQRDAALGKALETSGDTANAAAAWQKVYYSWPRSEEAVEAGLALERLRVSSRENFPPATARMMLERAAKLRSAEEYRLLISQLAGADRAVAQVRAVAGDYRALAALTVTNPEADAERLHHMALAARKLERESDMMAAVEQLGATYPRSRWHIDALTSVANGFLVRNDRDRYIPLYKACALDSAYCDWKVTWAAWIARSPEARELMQRHLTRHPQSEKASAALYFLGRYPEILERFPNSWYAILARDRYSARTTAALVAPSFAPTPATALRLERARLLDRNGSTDLAETELKWGAKRDAQPHIAALELARILNARGEPARGLRYIKSLAAGYLYWPVDSAPVEFWRHAFPLPWRSAIETHSRSQGLDPFMVAALIRQESEFDPRVVSSARAYGLTQVLPSTGRETARRLGVRGFTTAMLFEPDTNLRIGIWQMRALLDQYEGRWELALAAYNAGRTRANAWRNWGDFREPAEFVETIPFTETRNYVQIVLRNADLYRRLYSSSTMAFLHGITNP